MKPKSKCNHLEELEVIEAKSYECEECIKTGDSWVHLRTCQTCGVTLCCESSINQHAKHHFEATGHPVVVSAEPQDSWAWCYIDKQYRRL